MENIEKRTLMYETEPAVSELNKVPGFNPLNYLKKRYSEDKTQIICDLELKFRKLWFRLKYPEGTVRLIALKITDKLAIIEARVYLDKSDTTPVSSYIAQTYATEKAGRLYVEAAQYTAAYEALGDAGFGVQFYDVTKETTDFGMPDVDKPSAAESVKKEKVSKTAQTVPTEPEPVKPVAQETKNTSAQGISAVSNMLAEAGAPVINSPVNEETAEVEVPVKAEEPEQADVTAPSENIETSETNAEPAAKYTPDMTVEEIYELLTTEEAGDIVSDVGSCAGMTLREIFEKRVASLKWYLNGYTGDNNLLKAGAKRLLEVGVGQIAA